jgi:hypothetical protein
VQLCIVEWRDIIASSGWDTAEIVNCPTISSVGWFVSDDGATIKICNTQAPEEFDNTKDRLPYGVTAFPRGCVSKLEFISVGSVETRMGPDGAVHHTPVK